MNTSVDPILEALESAGDQGFAAGGGLRSEILKRVESGFARLDDEGHAFLLTDAGRVELERQRGSEQ